MKQTNTTSNVRPFGARDKWGYAMGDLGCNTSFALNSYLMLFYTQYIGLSLATWGVIIMILKVWDAINDPIMGALIDTIKPGKKGKFKTPIFYGSFLLMFSGALCFLPIPSAPYAVKVAVCMLAYLVWDLSYTIVNVPYGAMSSAITTDPGERAQLSTYRGIGSMIANIAVMVTLPMFCFDKENNLVGNRIFIIALILGFAGFIAFQLLLKWTTERVTFHPAENAQGERPKFNYFKALGNFLKNRAAVGLTLATIAQLIMTNSLGTANQILFQSYFGKAQLSGILGLGMMIPALVIIPMVKPLVTRFGKRELASAPLLVGAAASLGIIVLPVTPDTSGMILYLVLSFIIMTCDTFFMSICWAMIADCIDYQEMKTGIREEGTVYATYSLGRKLAGGFGVSLIAFLLIFTGYNEALGAQQPMEVANSVRILIGIVYMVCMLLQYVCLRFVYNLDKKTTLNMEEALHHTNVDLVGETPDED